MTEISETSETTTGAARRRTRLIVIISTAVVVLAGAAVAAALLLGGDRGKTDAPAPKPAQPTQAAEAPAPEPAKPIRVIAMGDMLPHDSVNQNAQLDGGGYDYAPFFAGIRGQLDSADVTFCNQEVPTAGVEFGVSGYPTFNAPTEFARDLRGAVGCDLVNLATNHNADKGVAGIAATRGVWDGLAPAVVSGANRSVEEQQGLALFEQDGVKFALVSFAEFSNAPIDAVSLNLIENDALVQSLMSDARANADVVIVSAHWGTEDSHEVNTAQRAFASKLAGLGADVIVGTGPHVLQPVEWLDRAGGGRTLVWYSIGNMLSTQLELDQRTGVIAGFDVARDEAGKVTVENPTAIVTYMHYDWTAEQESAGDLAARHNLSITPLADSAALLAQTRFGVTAEQQLQNARQILGPEVAAVDR